MKSYKRIISSLAVVVLLGACSKDAPFPDESMEKGKGQLRTSCLAPTIQNPEGALTTRAGLPSTDDFQIEITPEGKRTPVATYKYSEMPEILTLSAGEYEVKAHYGDNPIAEWESPYYSGSTKVSIEPDKITEQAEPIIASLSNIRVTVKFGPNLLGAMSADSKVVVKAGDEGVKTFEAGETRSAYFKYVNESITLTATFEGTVDGDYIVESKVYEDVAPGNHYTITFKMQGIVPDDPGVISPAVKVDATIETVDMNFNAEGEGDDELLTDDSRPNQGGSGSGDDPTPPTPPQEKTAPQITSAQPADKSMVPVNLDAVNVVTDKTYVVLNVSSSADGGITEFKVKIDSAKLTAEELENVGLSQNLDLVNPGALEEPLSGLGLPVNVGGKKDVSFDITGFMTLLSALGEGDHNFILTVGDANGTTTKTLKLHIN
ncbi:MAG: DUF4493 domain-containing protein [Muribaculaceae bacterium]|nr:DUF4493 domain-containing protein [Muribaculaceae bacterium]